MVIASAVKEWRDERCTQCPFSFTSPGPQPMGQCHPCCHHTSADTSGQCPHRYSLTCSSTVILQLVRLTMTISYHRSVSQPICMDRAGDLASLSLKFSALCWSHDSACLPALTERSARWFPTGKTGCDSPTYDLQLYVDVKTTGTQWKKKYFEF